MNWWQLTIYGIATGATGILSGIAGGGGGFLITPLAIILGLTPAQAISSGKFNGLAVTLGSLSGLRKYKVKTSWHRIAAISGLALIIGLCVPYVIKSFESRWYQLTLGVIVLLMVPVMFYKQVGIQPSNPSGKRKTLGAVLLSISLFLQGAFSGGLGALVNVVLMGMLGMTANEAHVTKRYSQIILNVVIVFGVLGANLIVWPAVAVGACAGLAGGAIGSRIAVKRGDKFAVDVLMAMMVIAALVLIIGALY